MGRYWYLVALLISLGIVFGVGGCGKKVKPVPPTKVTAVLKSSPDCNPDVDGRASPITIRIYELKTAGAFVGADFFSLYDKDKQVLAEDLVEREEVQLRPNGQQTIEREIKPDTRVLGAFAAFGDYDQAIWRATFDVPLHQTSQIQIECKGLALGIVPVQAPEEPKKKKWLPW